MVISGLPFNTKTSKFSRLIVIVTKCATRHFAHPVINTEP
jgi:hypothetical protein